MPTPTRDDCGATANAHTSTGNIIVMNGEGCKTAGVGISLNVDGTKGGIARAWVTVAELCEGARGLGPHIAVMGNDGEAPRERTREGRAAAPVKARARARLTRGGNGPHSVRRTK